MMFLKILGIGMNLLIGGVEIDTQSLLIPESEQKVITRQVLERPAPSITINQCDL